MNIEKKKRKIWTIFNVHVPRLLVFLQLRASHQTISTKDQCSTARTNVRFSSSGSLMPQSPRVVMDRRGFHLKVSIYQGWNDNHGEWLRFSNPEQSAQELRRSPFDAVGYELRSKLTQHQRRQTRSQTHRQIDSPVWGVKCKWMQSDKADRKGHGPASSCTWVWGEG